MTDKAIKPKPILSVGMCVMDIIHVCDSYPLEEFENSSETTYWRRGGNASIICTVLRQLGKNCEFLGMLSEAKGFGFLEEDCHKRGIAIDHCPSTTQDPLFSSVLLVKSNESNRTLIKSKSKFPILRYEHFRSIDLNNYSWIHFEACNPDETLRMLRDIHAHNSTVSSTERICISVEFKNILENSVLAPWADFVFLNKVSSQLLGWSDGKDAVYSMRKLLKENLNQETPQTKPAIITYWARQGSHCLTAEDEYIHTDSVIPEKFIDSLGVANTFCASTIFALEQGKSLHVSMVLGNRCVGHKLGHRGFDNLGDVLLNER